MSTRVARIKTFDQARNERFARFSFWPEITGSKQFRKTKEGYTGLTYGTYLDSLMAEIPGASGEWRLYYIPIFTLAGITELFFIWKFDINVDGNVIHLLITIHEQNKIS